MRIYTLVKTKLHDNTEVNHFPTMTEARTAMVDACRRITKCNDIGIGTYQENVNGYVVTIGPDYATISDGNVTEFEIFSDDIHGHYTDKTAKLVTFTVTTRVVIESSGDRDTDESRAFDAAREKILDNPSEYIVFDNLDSVDEDYEVPYDPSSDGGE